VTAFELVELLGLPIAVVENGLARLEGDGVVLRGSYTDYASRAQNVTEWCERHVLARIHRQTLGRLRREIAPVTAAGFLRWLLRWQHVAPGAPLAGERGTIEVMRQLQGFEAPANAWELQILPRRIAGYDPKILDRLCLGGIVGWGRLTPRAPAADAAAPARRVLPSSIAPIAFFLREDADWLALAPGAGKDLAGLSAAPREILAWLADRGASFFADIVRGTRRLKAEVETALWELVAAGRVTADDFDNLRALVDPRRRAGQGRGRAHRPRHSTGRWSLFDLPGEAPRHEALESACQMMLDRYGVVFREVVMRESIAPSWREILVTLRRLEDRGEVRGGRFVDGFLGEQFALPIAVESLRALRGEASSGEIVTVAAADPLNLIGILTPGERVASLSGKFIMYRDGVPFRVDERPPVPLALAR